ncbi:MAG: hypothetical protein M3Y48_05450 [Actinomycetota bacterium]|nr:hypothetical protein [Actinomycetota bacterium]
MITIRDRQRPGWVLYPHGAAGFGVLIADDAARTLADHIGDCDLQLFRVLPRCGA